MDANIITTTTMIIVR